MACFNIFNVFDIILHRVCSVQHEFLMSWTYPGSCRSCFSRKPVFGGKVSLIFPINYQIVDQNLALWSLPTAAWMPELSSFNWFGGKKEQFSQFAHIFHRDQTCLASLTSQTLKLLTNLYLLYLIWSCLKWSSWWLCRRHTRSTTP